MNAEEKMRIMGSRGSRVVAISELRQGYQTRTLSSKESLGLKPHRRYSDEEKRVLLAIR